MFGVAWVWSELVDVAMSALDSLDEDSDSVASGMTEINGDVA